MLERSVSQFILGCVAVVGVCSLICGCNSGGSAASLTEEDRKAFLSHPDPKHPPKEMFEYMKAHNVAAPQGPPAANAATTSPASTTANPSPATQ